MRKSRATTLTFLLVESSGLEIGCRIESARSSGLYKVMACVMPRLGGLAASGSGYLDELNDHGAGDL